MKRILLPLLTVSTLAAAAPGPAISVNGQPVTLPAQVIGGQTYIPISVLDALGIPYQSRAGRLLLGSVPGGSNERPALSGCRNEWLFNGVWRVKVGAITRISKDADTPGWGVELEVRNGTKATIMPTDAGWEGTGQGLHLAFADASTMNPDPYEIQKLTFNALPQGGVARAQLKYFAPLGTSASSLKAPTKLLIELDPKGIGDSTRAKGVAFNTPAPSFRIDLTCTK